MEKIENIISKIDLIKNNENIFTEEDYRLINKLFVSLQAIFPAFRQAWPTENEFKHAKREWMKAFKQANLTNIDDIKRGLDKFRLLENVFVPSPGQFIALCKKEAKEQSDTRNKEDFLLSAPEKQRRKEIGKLAIKNLLQDLLSK